MVFNFIKEKRTKELKEQIIRDIEKKYQIAFPEAYVQYHLEHDLDKISVCVFNIKDEPYEVSRMIPLSGEGLNFELYVSDNRENGYIDSRFYPVAMDRGENVYYWDSASGEIFYFPVDDIENPIFIAKDINEFFALLESSTKL